MHVHGLGKRRRAAEDMEAIYAALLQNQEAISDLKDLLYPISDDDDDDDEGDDDDEEGRAAALLGELEDLEEEQELMLAVLNELGANFERLSQSLGVQRQHFGLNSAFFREDPSETSHPPACGRTSVSTQAKSDRSSRRSGSRGATC